MRLSDITEVRTLDYHAAGEPCRILYDTLRDIPGETMRARLDYMKSELDDIRAFLMQEPRGHKDMFGSILTRPASDDADAGIIYMDANGYLDMCIHGTICTCKAIADSGMPLKDPNKIVLDAVCGRIVATLNRDASGRVESVTVRNVPSFVLTPEPLELYVAGVGSVTADVVFAGNFFVITPFPLDGALDPKRHGSRDMVDVGMRIKEAANKAISVSHPFVQSTRTIALSAVFQIKGENPLRVKNTVVFGEGQLDRSPCGSGTSALMTYLHARGLLPIHAPYISESYIGSEFRGELAEETTVGPYKAVIPLVTGKAFRTAATVFYREADDPYRNGFVVAP